MKYHIEKVIYREMDNKRENISLCARIQEYNNILIVGAGGGYDVYTGLPLYFNLRHLGKTVHLANFSFASVDKLQQYPKISDSFIIVYFGI